MCCAWISRVLLIFWIGAACIRYSPWVLVVSRCWFFFSLYFGNSLLYFYFFSGCSSVASVVYCVFFSSVFIWLLFTSNITFSPPPEAKRCGTWAVVCEWLGICEYDIPCVCSTGSRLQLVEFLSVGWLFFVFCFLNKFGLTSLDSQNQAQFWMRARLSECVYVDIILEREFACFISVQWLY